MLDSYVLSILVCVSRIPAISKMAGVSQGKLREGLGKITFIGQPVRLKLRFLARHFTSKLGHVSPTQSVCQCTTLPTATGQVPPPNDASPVEETCGHAVPLRCCTLGGRTELVDIHGITSVREAFERIATAFELNDKAYEIKILCQSQLLTMFSDDAWVSELLNVSKENGDVTIVVQSLSVCWTPDQPFHVKGKLVEKISRDPAQHSDYMISFCDGSIKRHGATPQLEVLFRAILAMSRCK